jgi:hypothetical protein
MNNRESLLLEDWTALSVAFGSSLGGFYLVYEGTYWLFERMARSGTAKLHEYRLWTP